MTIDAGVTLTNRARTEFMTRVFALEDLCLELGARPDAAGYERIRMARRAVVAAYDQQSLRAGSCQGAPEPEVAVVSRTSAEAHGPPRPLDTDQR